MKRKLAVLTAPVLFAIALIRPCELKTAAAPKAEDDFQLVKVADGVYAPEELQKRRADAAKQLSETPEDQKDKRATLERQIRRLDALMAIKLTNPTLTFGAGTVHLYLGKREVILSTLPGHTGGDVLAYVPDANVVFTGD